MLDPGQTIGIKTRRSSLSNWILQTFGDLDEAGLKNKYLLDPFYRYNVLLERSVSKGIALANWIVSMECPDSDFLNFMTGRWFVSFSGTKS